MRFSMIRILISREVRRLKKNPSALMLIGLLAAIALMMATSRPMSQKPGTVPVSSVWIITDRSAEWLDHLEKHLPDRPVVRIVDRETVEQTRPRFLPSDGLLNVRHEQTARGLQVSLSGRYPGTDPKAMDVFWEWFWPQLLTYQHQGLNFEYDQTPLQAGPRAIEQQSVSELMTPELVGTMLLLIVQFFACCHLLVSCTSQDRERGTLMALALSPAHISEIMTAKFIFHIALSVSGCLVIVSILKPAALSHPVFWMTMLLTSTGLMCVGLCISTLTRSQASAGLLALCYMLAGAGLFYLSTKFTGFRLLKMLTFESYSFPLLYGSLRSPERLFPAPGLTAMFVLVAGWLLTARHCFTRFGWR